MWAARPTSRPPTRPKPTPAPSLRTWTASWSSDGLARGRIQEPRSQAPTHLLQLGGAAVGAVVQLLRVGAEIVELVVVQAEVVDELPAAGDEGHLGVLEV